jgi:beta-glucosidase
VYKLVVCLISLCVVSLFLTDRVVTIMVRLLTTGLILAGLSLAHANPNASLANAVYKDASQSVDARVENLVSLMTLEEKMAQLMQGIHFSNTLFRSPLTSSLAGDISNWLNTTSGEYNQTGLEFNFANRSGMFYVGYPISWDWLAEGIKKGQDYAVNNTRLGIPAIVQTEGIHGFLIGNATIFNSPIAQACSFNRELQRQMGEQIAIEAAALGVSQLFAPLADLARELRYGRVEETYGEDGFLAGEMAYNYIVGCQGQNVSAMVKHFAAYSAPEGGLNTAPVHGGERELRTTWLPPFHRAIIDGGAYAVMSAYHAYDGIPAVADYHMLTEILRDEWGMLSIFWALVYRVTDFFVGYKYFVSSDAGATDRLFKNFLTCGVNDFGCVTEQCLTAGNDVEVSDLPCSLDRLKLTSHPDGRRLLQLPLHPLPRRQQNPRHQHRQQSRRQSPPRKIPNGTLRKPEPCCP